MIHLSTTVHQPAPHGRHARVASPAGALAFALPGEAEVDPALTADERQGAAGDGNALPACLVLDPFAALAAFSPVLSAENPNMPNTPDAPSMVGAPLPVAEAMPGLSSLQSITGALETSAPAVQPSASPLTAGFDPSGDAAPPDALEAMSDVSAQPTPFATFEGQSRTEPLASLSPLAVSPLIADRPRTDPATLPAIAPPLAPKAPAPPVVDTSSPLDPGPGDLVATGEQSSSLMDSQPSSRRTERFFHNAPSQTQITNLQTRAGAGVAAPAGVVFAAKLAGRSDDATQPMVARSQGEPLGTVTAADLGTAPMAAADGAALDLTQHGWPEAMIERIEALRDAADAADTSIRLLPDALGSVEVGVRQEGDTLHVRFSAAEAHTRALLHDAQPRLAEAAEARGLRLGQSSVDTGGAGQQHAQHRPSGAEPAPRRPASSSTDAEATDLDDRIA